MKYKSAPAFRQALERRLPALSHETGRSPVRLRKEVAFDRLLARLVATAPDRWLLKGALALDYRFGSRARTTRDIDLATAGDEASATVDLLAAQAVDLGDFFSFAIERTSALDRIRDAAAVRYHVIAELAGRTFDEFVLDVGFDQPLGVELAPTARTRPARLRRPGAGGGRGVAARVPDRGEGPRLHARLRRSAAGQHACQGSRRPGVDRD